MAATVRSARTMRCTEVAERPLPDGKFPCRDIGDRGRSCFRSDFLVLVLSETVLVLVLERMQMAESIFDHERLDVYRLAIEYVTSSYRIAAIHDILLSFEAIDPELNRVGKTNVRRIVSMLTRLIQRTDTVSEGSNEYEYEYRPPRRTEYEYEKKHEQSIRPKCSIDAL